ncbi:response regulator [Brasilonema bromeliae]|uniref:Two-component system response regulator n=1 Tax=Brasilonema bromeliae SPC951 TaxID=385972 RepID=A0ABX1P4W6_9CYAN|nr:response regulator [Brasilonema bromeliae]NMG18587.1 two-component system response regulator [Brasilonema bromeliae SPC951]
MNNFGTFTKLRPLSLLRHLSNCSESTCLQVLSSSISWSIYLEQGKITYATHSVEPFDRLERHLRRLSHHVPSIVGEVRVQLRLMFEPDTNTQPVVHHSDNPEELIPPPIPPEYQAICWLVSERYLHSTQAAVLIQELVKEVLESYFLTKQATFTLKDSDYRVPTICKLDVEKIAERCQQKLQNWHSLGPHISSPYQRPYLLMKTTDHQKNLSGIEPQLTEWMKGFSLRHLSVIMNQDEVQLAKTLYPHILNGTILLHEPDPPFDKLPKTFTDFIQASRSVTGSTHTKLVDSEVGSTRTTYSDNSAISASHVATQQRQTPVSPEKKEIQKSTISNNNNLKHEAGTSDTVTPRKVYKIISVDDSPTILKEISRFLEDENFSVVTINDPLKAVMSIIRYKPDLILLDLNMDGMDGYELCRIVRNNSMFKKTPIIMVTGNKGLVDRVKARLVGASGYLTKPFTRADLLKIVFTYLA